MKTPRFVRVRGLRASMLAATAAATLAAASTASADPPDASAGALVLRRCQVEYERNTPVGAALSSVIQDCLVQPGQRVKAGQVLGRLLDAEARAELALREAEASTDVEVRLAEAKQAQAQAKLQRTAALMRRNAASAEEYTQHKLESAASALEVEQAKYRLKLAAIRRDQARAAVQMREITSPHDGVVLAILHRAGESVMQRDPVYQVADVDHLRVVALVDVAEAWRLRVGQPVRVIPEIAGADLPVEREVFAGEVAFVDSQIDPLTRTCKVFVRARNRDGLLRAGLEARVEIDPEPAATAAAAPDAPPATAPVPAPAPATAPAGPPTAPLGR